MMSDPQSFERYSRFLQTLSRSLTVLGANDCTKHTRNVIHCAVRDNILNRVEHILLEEDLSKDGAALEIAAKNGQLNIVEWLLKNRRLLESSGRAALNLAIYKGHNDVAIRLIKAGFSYGRNTYGETLLYVAARAANAQMTEHLILLGCNVHAMTRTWTPLHVAAYHDHVNVLAVLLKHGGAQPLIRNKDGKNALHIALGQGHVQSVKRMLLAGCMVDMQDLMSRLTICDQIQRNPAIRKIVRSALCEPKSLLDASRIKLRQCLLQPLHHQVDLLRVNQWKIPNQIRNLIMMEDIFPSIKLAQHSCH